MAGIGDYVSKIHFEMVRSDLKVKEQDRQRGGSRTPWQVGVDGVRNGERTDIARWREYVEATRGLRVHEPSRSIRAMYGKPGTTGADMTDEELAAEAPEQGIPEVGIANDLWGTARRTRREGQSVIAQALLALEDDGIEAMRLSLETGLRRAVVIDAGGELPLVRFRSAKAGRLIANTSGQREEDNEEVGR